MRVLRCTKIMWKTQVLLSILLCADSLQETREENSLANGKISRSILGGPFLNPPLVLSLAYGLLRENKTPKPQQMKGNFVVFRPDRFHRPRNDFTRPFRNWGPPSFPGHSAPTLPVTYIVSQPLDFGYDANPQGSAGGRNVRGPMADIEFYRSDSFTLPPEVTVYHPTDHAKDYLFDEVADKELLIGEKRKASNDHEDATEIMVDGDQYFRGNRKPLVFDSQPKNIYEIFSAEKLLPQNLEVIDEKKRNLSWQQSLESSTVGGGDVLKVKAVDGEELVTDESDAEEVEDRKTTDSEGGVGCEGNVDGDEENIDLRVEKLAERKGADEHTNKMESRLDVVVIGQQTCR